MLLSQQQKDICGSERLVAPLGTDFCQLPYHLSLDQHSRLYPTMIHLRIFWTPTIFFRSVYIIHLLSPMCNLTACGVMSHPFSSTLRLGKRSGGSQACPGWTSAYHSVPGGKPHLWSVQPQGEFCFRHPQGPGGREWWSKEHHLACGNLLSVPASTT